MSRWKGDRHPHQPAVDFTNQKREGWFTKPLIARSGVSLFLELSI
ncbi:MAG TPA: hypothetical protein V6D16_17210 [Candidatus Obscuribacterales bacterium]